MQGIRARGNHRAELIYFRARKCLTDPGVARVLQGASGWVVLLRFVAIEKY